MNHFQDNTVSTITRRLLPFLMLLYLIAYIDRSNISVAALQMNAELGLSAQMYGIGAGLFYLTYIIFEVPSNVILARVGARRWIARIMVSWGIVACGMAFIQNAGQLYTMRLLLGAAEAGFTPGIIFYLSRWFPATRRARAMSFFYMAATMASVIGLPLSGALLKMNGIGGFSGWRWLYFVEGVPAILLGVVVLKVLPDGPAEAKWLTSAQQEWLVTTIAAESANAPASHGHGWHRAFSDRRVWALGLFWLLQAFGTIGITVFLPQILKGLSSASNFVVTLYAALPFIFASLLMYLNGHHSDRTRERRFHLAAPMIAAGILLAVSLRVGSLPLTYLLLILTIGLNWAATPVFWSVTTEYLAGSAAAASAIALINSIANIAGVGLPPVMGAIRDRTGRYDGGLLLVAAALFLGGLLALWLVAQTRGETGEQDTGVKAS
jgi:MFS transporter, ACS family, tartrate transporter